MCSVNVMHFLYFNNPFFVLTDDDHRHKKKSKGKHKRKHKVFIIGIYFIFKKTESCYFLIIFLRTVIINFEHFCIKSVSIS